MTTDDCIAPSLFHDVLDALERHGYHHHDRQHTRHAMGIIRDLARIYEGTQDHPYGPSTRSAPTPPPSGPPSPRSRDAVTISASDRKTLLIALDTAADAVRDRAEMCPSCPGQSCPACQFRLLDAPACDQLAGRIGTEGSR